MPSRPSEARFAGDGSRSVITSVSCTRCRMPRPCSSLAERPNTASAADARKASIGMDALRRESFLSRSLVA
ncbi:MAG: hypothetical protein ACYSX0_04965 [Planctomycetota bacterium]|jgi:hypothetical protein